MDTKFLTLEEVLELHATRIERYGGSFGVRDPGLLQSALEMPRAMFGGQYLHEDLFSMASAYLFHLVQNHAFIDGNKRIGLAAALSFLDINGVEIIADEDILYEMVLSVAEGLKNKEAIAEFLREHASS
ncbi:MAG: type II toxin-antitoxin system death-on-curing family toxin [Chloroflexota bacterium]|nr:type II toxin-antitoxin system death-on-curing family toxin [Chloroflexota bacterium]